VVALSLAKATIFCRRQLVRPIHSYFSEIAFIHLQQQQQQQQQQQKTTEERAVLYEYSYLLTYLLMCAVGRLDRALILLVFSSLSSQRFCNFALHGAIYIF